MQDPTFLTLLPNSCAAVPVLKTSFEFCSGPADSKESQVFVGEDLEFHKRRLGLERMLRVHQRLRDPHSVLAADRPQPTARLDVPECGNPFVPSLSGSDCVVSRVDISRASVSPMVSASPSVCSSLSLASVASAAFCPLLRLRPLLLVLVLLLCLGVVMWWHWVGLKVGIHGVVPVFHSVGSSHARDMDSGIALGNANSCADTGNLLRVQRDNSCRKVRLKSTVGEQVCRADRRCVASPWMLEHIDGLPTKRTTRGRSRGSVGQKALGEVLVLVLVWALVVGQIWLGVPWAALRPFEGFLALW